MQAVDVLNPQPTPEPVRQAYVRAYARAAKARLVAYRNDDGTYGVPSHSTPGEEYTVRVTGRRWSDLACTCPGSGHLACMHRAVVVHGRKYGVFARRPGMLMAVPDPLVPAVLGAADAAALASGLYPAWQAPVSDEVIHSVEYRRTMAAVLGLSQYNGVRAEEYA